MATPLAAGIMAGWPETAASIPTNWDRVTDFDSRHPKGTAASTDPDVGGGSATHLHTSPSHAHSIGSHTHTGNIISPPGNWPSRLGNDPITAGQNHTHTVPTSSAQTDTASGAATWQTSSNDPDSFVVIWLESDGVPTGFPDGSLIYWDTATPPSGWTQHVASKNKFLRGAVAAGDGGGTAGGSHSHTADSHVHDLPHTHTVTSNGPSHTNNTGNDAGTLVKASSTHVHSITLSAFQNTIAETSASTSSDLHEPPWHKLAIIENTSGSDDQPAGAIALWRGLLANIPTNWVLCDGTLGTPDLRDKFIKGANLLSEVDDLGGTAGHDHTDPTTHNHNVNHRHSQIVATDGAAALGINSSSGIDADDDHGHTVVNSAFSAGTSGTSAQTVDANSDTEPLNRTVAFIQFLGAVEVQIDSPTDMSTVISPGFIVDWSLPGMETQNDFQVEIWDNSGASGAPIVDSGVVVSATEEWTLTVPNDLVNNTDYWLRVTVHDDLNALGVSDLRAFSTSWTPPATVGGVVLTRIDE